MTELHSCENNTHFVILSIITYNSCVFMLLPCKTKSDNTIYKYKYVAEFVKVCIKLWNNEMMKMPWLWWLVASHSRGPGLIPGLSKWDLWCTEWSWDRLLSEYFCFLFSVSFHQCSRYFIHLVDNLSNWQHH